MAADWERMHESHPDECGPAIATKMIVASIAATFKGSKAVTHQA